MIVYRCLLLPYWVLQGSGPGIQYVSLEVQVRDVYWTFRNFRNRVADFLRYRRVTANMDERFPEAGPEDLARSDGICIICREEMAAGRTRNKCLPCGHVFHLHCLRWALVIVCKGEWGGGC